MVTDYLVANVLLPEHWQEAPLVAHVEQVHATILPMLIGKCALKTYRVEVKTTRVGGNLLQ